MNLTLSWDLFVIVFTALVVTYSFIIGKKESVKIIISSYIAIVAVQGIGNVCQRLFGDPNAALGILGFSIDTTITSILKLALFIAIIVFLAVRAGLHVQYSSDGTMVISLVITALCGVATAGLLLATLITYISGAALLDPQIITQPAVIAVTQQSTLMSVLITNLDLFFTFPAAVLIGTGYMSNR